MAIDVTDVSPSPPISRQLKVGATTHLSNKAASAIERLINREAKGDCFGQAPFLPDSSLVC
jgi:hypothetical protein